MLLKYVLHFLPASTEARQTNREKHDFRQPYLYSDFASGL